MERWGRSDQMRECLSLHQHEFAERTRQRHVLLFVCMRVYVWVRVYSCVFRSFTVPGSYLGLGNWTKPLIKHSIKSWCVTGLTLCSTGMNDTSSHATTATFQENLNLSNDKWVRSFIPNDVRYHRLCIYCVVWHESYAFQKSIVIRIPLKAPNISIELEHVSFIIFYTFPTHSVFVY